MFHHDLAFFFFSHLTDHHAANLVVVGALLGIFVAVIHPLRGLFVDLVDRNSSAPLEWIFDGLYNIGQAAVPVNMIILGCNLSSSINQYTGKDEKVCKDGLFSKSTLISIVFGKMILMPVIGILSAVFLRFFVLNVPPQLEGSFYLVLMIVCKFDYIQFLCSLLTLVHPLKKISFCSYAMRRQSLRQPLTMSWSLWSFLVRMRKKALHP